MLRGLVEIEGVADIAAAVARLPTPLLPFAGRAMAHLEYLFYGQSLTAPDLHIAGGLTRSGHSVTGSGRSLSTALAALAGETAEVEMRGPDRNADAAVGYGAGIAPAQAETHARNEVVERLHVCHWWAGAGKAAYLEWDTNTLAPKPRFPDEIGLSGRKGRLTDLVHVADCDALQVVVALSFDPAGGSFCFGAACRDGVKTACAAALSELAQAEFGLDLARMKRGRFGEAALGRADRLALDHSTALDRDGLRAAPHFAAKPVVAPGLAGFADRLVVHPLGVFENCLHVVRAEPVDRLPVPSGGQHLTAHGPY